MSDFTVVMLEKVAVLALRIRQILENSKICVFDADSENKLLNTLSGIKQEVTLVILDLDIEMDYAMELLVETRKRIGTTPIIVLTPSGRKNFFVEALLSGATDFILKPFDDQTFLSKIIKYMAPGHELSKAELITLDLQSYIKGELRKAEKGSFPLSIMFFNFQSSSPDTENDSETIAAIYADLKELFWDTDIFIRFGSKFFLGIFPFCDEKNTGFINNKLNLKLEEMKRQNKKLEDYSMKSVSVSYPFDTTKTAMVYDVLLGRINLLYENE